MVVASCSGGLAGQFGFSPNDLVFGHKLRGPLTVLCDGLKEHGPPVSLLQYVNGFRRQLFPVTAGEMAKENLLKKQKKMKCWFDKKTSPVSFVLVIRFCLCYLCLSPLSVLSFLVFILWFAKYLIIII